MKRIVVAVALVALALIVTACDTLLGDAAKTVAAQKVFSMDEFEQNIIDSFEPNSVGFTYVIAKNGVVERSDAIGLGRTAADGGPRDIAVTDRMHIASVAKTITTAAVLRLLQDTPGVGLDSLIEPYLPPFNPTNGMWTRGPGISSLTFRRLLLHRSGFDFSEVANGETDALLSQYIANGVTLPLNPATYDNVHHALFRVIVPYVLGETKGDLESDEDFHSRVFSEYVQQVVFGPAGITADRVSFVPAGDANRYYRWPEDGLPGVGGSNNDFRLSLGAYGWYMSVLDVGRFLAYLRFTENIISAESREIMNDERLGWWNTRVGTYGTYYIKQGSWRWTTTPTRGMQAVAANLSGGIQAAVIMNSRADDALGAAFNMASIMRDAFDDAHIEQQ